MVITSAGPPRSKRPGSGARQQSASAARRGPDRRRRRDALAALGFLTPSLIGFAVFVFGPILAVVVLSFFEWSLLSDPTFIGGDNFVRLISDERLRSVYGSTVYIAVFAVLLNIVLGLCLALLLESGLHRRIRTLFRLTYVFPYIVSAAAVALIWRFLLSQDLGLVNYFLGFLGADRINWLGSSTWSPISVIVVYTWKSLGFSILVYIAGLQSIPAEVREAATVDGAGAWTSFWRITLPLLSPTVFFLVVINTINAFQMFAEPLVLTNGGPGDSSRTVVMYIYETAFNNFHLGYSSTVALSLFVVLLIMTAIQFRLSRRWTFYS